MNNIRYNISPCEQGEVASFINKIDTSLYVPNGTVKATERSHYDRYSFLRDDNRIAVVYDTTANIVSITGRSDHAKQLLELFDPERKTVKQSTVPAQGSLPRMTVDKYSDATEQIKSGNGAMRAKLFVSPDSIRRRAEFAPAPTVFASANGALIQTDEIFPPQTSSSLKRKREESVQTIPDVRPRPIVRPLTSYGEATLQKRSEKGEDNARSAGISISVGGRIPSATPRRAVISFGTDDYAADGDATKNSTPQAMQAAAEQPVKRKRGRPPKAKLAEGAATVDTAAVSTGETVTDKKYGAATGEEQPVKRKRGRPPKNKQTATPVTTPTDGGSVPPPEYKNGYSVKNFSPEALNGAVRGLRALGKTVLSDGVENVGTPHELRAYTVTDGTGQKVLLRYATKKMTLQLQGKQSELFAEVVKRVDAEAKATESVKPQAPQDPPIAVRVLPPQQQAPARQPQLSPTMARLKKRIPTAFDYLSDQSKTDFTCGIRDFSQSGLQLSDYSVLLVPAFRALERFVFDLQRARDIDVKMIGQAYDKDDSGRYVLKSGYCKRIDSVIYPEVMVALYTEYFSQRNFFAHSDNTDNNVSRSIPDKATALKIFTHILDVVEYNAKKLKEIGFTMRKK